LRALLLTIGIGVALLVLVPPLIDEGEVVILVTQDGARSYETPLWVVTLDGHEYVRASNPDRAWLERVRNDPSVWLRPEDDESALRLYRAEVIDNDAVRNRVNKAMAAKYGTADRVWARVSHRSASIPVRLITAEPGAHASALESSSPNRGSP
jgi:hypothetical protein